MFSLVHMKRPAALLLVLSALGVTACGDEEETDSGGRAADEVKATMTAYLKATAEGDGKTACSRLTDKARRLAAQAQGAKAKTCEGVIAEAARGMRDDHRERLRAVRPADVDVTIDGDHAVAKAAGATADLVRHDEHWLVDALGTG